MFVLPPFLLIFDSSALISGRTRDWQLFSRIGTCFVPDPVLEEIRLLSDRAIEPPLESTAREFLRFYPTSGWQTAIARASHPTLTATEGHALSSKARLALSVAQVTFGLAQQYPKALVVLVSSDQGLLRRILALNTANLCGLPLTALIQWVRTERKPVVVAHHLQQMHLYQPTEGNVRAAGSARSHSLKQARSRSFPPQPPQPSRSLSGITGTTSVGKAPLPTASRSTAVVSRSLPIAPPPSRIVPLRVNAIRLLMLIIVGMAAWRTVSPASFGQVWKQLPWASPQQSH